LDFDIFGRLLVVILIKNFRSSVAVDVEQVCMLEPCRSFPKVWAMNINTRSLTERKRERDAEKSACSRYGSIMMYPEPRNPSGPELAGLLAALLQQRHPAVPRFSAAEDALAFLLDQCTIAVFERFGDSDEGDSGTAFFMLMDQGPQFVSLAIFDPGSGRWQLFHATLDDFAPYEAPSKRPPRQPPAVIARSAQPRAADAADLADFLRMFRAVHDPFLMEQFKTDAARLDYLASEVRIAIFDYGQSGPYEGPLACFLWPAQTRFVMVAIKTNNRWRFASAELGEG